MDTGILHAHQFLFVPLYILLFLVKAVLILGGKKEALQRLNTRTKVVHIVLAVGMTLTGLFLVFRAPGALQTTYLLKYVLLLAIIGFGVMAVKRMSRGLAVLVLLLLGYTFAISKAHSPALESEQARLERFAAVANDRLQENQVAYGKALYERSCQRCHGANGEAAYRKSKNLAAIPADTAYVVAFLNNAVKPMPSYSYLQPYEQESIAAYVLTFQTGGAKE